MKQGNVIVKRLIMLIMFFAAINMKASAQPKTYQPHQVIDMGNGLKVEILSCRGEGPLEECDCIYYTETRQTGKRMKQNANRIREEEKSAMIVKEAALKLRRQQIADSMALARASGVKELIKKEKPVDENSPELTEKRVMQRIKNLSIESKSSPSLADIARVSDSTSKTRQKTGKIIQSRSNDTAVIDAVYIPNKPVIKIEEAKMPEVVVVEKKKEPVVAAEKKKEPLVVPGNTSMDRVITPKPGNEKEAVTDSAAEQTSYVKQYDRASSNPAPVVEKKENPVSKPMATDVAVTQNKSTEPVNISATTEKNIAATLNNTSTNSNDTINLDTEASKNSTEKNKSNSNNEVIKRPDTFVDNTPKTIAQEHKTAIENIAKNDTAAISKTTEPTKNLGARPSSANDFLKTAEVNVKGNWEKAIIVDREGESLYKVHYQGKGDEADEWVTMSQLRNLDSVKNVPAVASLINEQKERAKESCSFDAPAPAFSNASQFSDKIAQRKIYENFLHAKKKSGQGKIGIIFLYFQNDAPYTNEVSFSATQDLKAKNAYAPTGALIYPVKTKIKICDQTGDAITTNVVDRKYSCYRNNDGVWTCTPDK